MELFFTFLNTFYGQKSTWVLPRANQLDIKELLNPTHEHEIIATNVSDEEIFESVHEHQRGEEMMEINGGEDTNEEIINMPSHQDALAASLTLLQYVANLDDPCAQKLKAILVGFGCQVCLQEVRDMKPTLRTSYFASNCS